MSEEEIIACLRLQKTPLIGDITAKRLISHLGSASAVFRPSSSVEKIDGIGAKLTQVLRDKTYQKQAEQEWDFIVKNNISFCHFQQDDYPYYLKHCVDGPILLFYRGTIDFQKKRLISVVGTRNITAYGADFCRQLIAELTPWNPVIISGLAYGVDIAAHREALKNGLSTWACLAHGFQMIYPKTHQKYVAEIERNGGFITDFGYLSPFDRKNFLRRNRIIAGLSPATIVIESAEKGGSLVTADIAFSYNREVFAVPGRSSDIYSVGCNQLIKTEKARLITSAQDLVLQLNWDTDSPCISQTPSSSTLPDLTSEEKIIYDFLYSNGKQLIDIISKECQIPIQQLSVLLFQMEMKGIVRPLPGKSFEII